MYRRKREKVRTRITREILRGRLSGEWWCFGDGVLRIKLPEGGGGGGDCGGRDEPLMLQKYGQMEEQMAMQPPAGFFTESHWIKQMAASVALAGSSIIFR